MLDTEGGASPNDKSFKELDIYVCTLLVTYMYSITTVSEQNISLTTTPA